LTLHRLLAKLISMFRCGSLMRRAGFSLALLASLCGGAIPLPHADGIDDFACSPVPVAHDESAHSIGADPTPEQGHSEHCFLCHALRSFHSAFDTFEQHDNAPHAERLHLSQIDRAGRVEWTSVPGRAPPA